jgi:hypothetical protein
MSAYRTKTRRSGKTTILKARATAVEMRDDIPCEWINLNETEAAKPHQEVPICHAFFILFRYLPCQPYEPLVNKNYIFCQHHHHQHIFNRRVILCKSICKYKGVGI